MMRFVTLLCACLLIISCGSSSVQLDKSNDVLLQEGILYAESGKYSKAAENFRTVIINSENPDMAKNAQLMLADAYYNDKEYLDAIGAYEVYNEYYVNTADTPYVLFQIGKAYSQVALKPSRDSTFTRQSVQYLEDLRQRFPESYDSYEAVQYHDKMLQNLAEHEYFVARYYMRIRKPESTVSRLLYLLREFPDSSRIEDSYELMIKASLKIPGRGMVAQSYLEELESLYPANRELESLQRKISKQLEKEARGES